MQAFTKIVSIGRSRATGTTYCKIQFDDSRLSIAGVEGPKANGDCLGSCGQIVMHEWRFDSLCPGWNPELIAQFRAVWKRWHLNDMTPGSPAQMQWLRGNPEAPRDYTWASKALADAGLNPDPSNGYKYGHAWLFEPVPSDVLSFLQSLPDSDTSPAWV